MIDLTSMSQDQMIQFAKDMNQPAFRGKQLFKWIHKGVASVDEMTDLSKEFRDKVSEQAFITCPIMRRKQESKQDGTIKYLWELSDGNCIETVLMRYRHGNSICISSQVGCLMGCVFCASAIGEKVRNLSAGELLAQVLFTKLDSKEPISNIVIMGIGEPLENYDSVLKFLHLVNHKDGLGIGMRHISLSTCGLIPAIERLQEEKLQITLSVSLHAPDNETRTKLMPINKIYPVEDLLQACQNYFEKTGRRISFEYAMIEGVNDSIEQAKHLARHLRGTASHVNLIPLNHIDESPLLPSKNVAEFQKCLQVQHIPTTVRRRLGNDIDASCGQLRKKAMKQTASKTSY